MNLRNDVAKAQERMYEILVAFNGICQKHNLQYWLAYGTLLGAVRHKDFIPWDDDLDVIMPREDYEKFLSIAQEELPDNYFLQTPKTDKYYHNFFAKIRDRESTFIDVWEKKRDVRYHQGIYIDIFPHNTISDSNLVKTLYRTLAFVSKLMHNRHIRLMMPVKPVIFIMNSFHKKDGHIVVSGGECMHYPDFVAREKIFPLKKIVFHKGEFPVPKDADTPLKLVFGKNYMELPPKEKQKVHSVNILLDTPCRYEREHEKDSHHHQSL